MGMQKAADTGAVIPLHNVKRLEQGRFSEWPIIHHLSETLH